MVMLSFQRPSTSVTSRDVTVTLPAARACGGRPRRVRTKAASRGSRWGIGRRASRMSATLPSPSSGEPEQLLGGLLVAGLPGRILVLAARLGPQAVGHLVESAGVVFHREQHALGGVEPPEGRLAVGDRHLLAA